MKIEVLITTFNLIQSVVAIHNPFGKGGIGYGGLDMYSKPYDRNRSYFFTNRHLTKYHLQK